MSSRVVPSLATALVSGLLVAGATVPAQAAPPSSSVVRIPAQVTAASGGSYVSAPVRYKCTNTRRYTHYVTSMLTQPGPGGWDVTYVAGYRGDTGGMVRAKCTGKTVTHWLRLKEGAYSNPEGSLAKGGADLEVSLERRGIGSGGAYRLYSSVSKAGAVTVR